MDYARTVVEHFVVLRGKGSAVSSADEWLLLGWERDGFPLDIVLEGIDQAFERKTDPPKSLTECGRWVRSGYKKWSKDFDESAEPPIATGGAEQKPSGGAEQKPSGEPAALPGLPPQHLKRLRKWRKSDFRPLREAAEEMWEDLVAQVAADGVISEEVTGIVDDAVRLLALDKGATEAQLGERLGD